MKTIDLVIKIGSMALIQREDGAIDYNIFQRLGDDLRPGMALVTSGATEIGRGVVVPARPMLVPGVAVPVPSAMPAAVIVVCAHCLPLPDSQLSLAACPHVILGRAG